MTFLNKILNYYSQTNYSTNILPLSVCLYLLSPSPSLSLNSSSPSLPIQTSSLIQSTKTQYSEMVVERDALLLKLKQTDQDRARSQKLEEELNRIKLSLESELRLKLRLQEENEKVCIVDFTLLSRVNLIYVF